MTEGPNTPGMGDPPHRNQASGGTPGSPPPPSGGGSGGPPPPAPQAPQPGSGVGAPADLMTRFLAKLIDGILLGIVYTVVVVTVVLGAIFGAATGGFTGDGGFVASLVSAVITTALFVGYYAFMESNRGQTLGKMLMKIKVVGPDGGNPTMEQALKRNAYFALGLIGIIPFLGFIAWLVQLAAVIYIAVTINNDTANRQGWHDEFAGGTRVLKTD